MMFACQGWSGELSSGTDCSQVWPSALSQKHTNLPNLKIFALPLPVIFQTRLRRVNMLVAG